MIQTQPTIGIRPIRIHQPLRLVSCRRRMPTPRVGSSTASWYRSETACPLPLLPVAAATTTNTPIAMIALMRANHQYSGRAARPPNTAYFLITSVYQCMRASPVDSRDPTAGSGSRRRAEWSAGHDQVALGGDAPALGHRTQLVVERPGVCALCP